MIHHPKGNVGVTFKTWVLLYQPQVYEARVLGSARAGPGPNYFIKMGHTEGPVQTILWNHPNNPGKPNIFYGITLTILSPIVLYFYGQG